MEMVDGALQIDAFLTVTLGIIVLFIGKRLNAAIGFLREFSTRARPASVPDS